MKDAWSRRACIVCVGHDDASIGTDELDQLAQVLQAGERHRFATFTRPDRRRQFVLGHGLLRHMLTGCGLVATITVADDGAPLLEDGLRTNPAHVSLSHSGPRFTAALAAVPLGIDIEGPRRFRDTDGALELLSDRPSPASLANDADDRTRRAWVLAEACYKARRGKSNGAIAGLWRTQWEGCELALAGCASAPSAFHVDLRLGSYNPLHLQWCAVV